MSSFDQTACSHPEYGALAHNLPGCGPEKFYITTAISYTNGFPHIGHAYEFLSTDAIARYYRVLGYDTFFLTGTDEHGQKVAASAEKNGLSPLEHCNIYVKAFQELNKRLLVTYSDFIRTTHPHHELTSQTLWKRCHENGDIYLGSYEGWYNEREETFVTDADAEAAGFKDAASGVPLKRVKEESYFFRMSAYTDRLIAHIEEHPSFVEPEQFRNNVLARLKKEGLKDLSISRTSFNWGIPVPEGFAREHVMYVWFDALTNYLSGVDGLQLRPQGAPAGSVVPGCNLLPTKNPAEEWLERELGHSLSEYWPAARHVIGKDIVWFHCVIWPCMLMSAGVPLPGNCS